MSHLIPLRRVALLALLAVARGHAADDAFLAAIAASPVVDEVAVGAANPGHRFTEAPAGASSPVVIAGVPARALAATAGYRLFAVRLGEGRGLVAGATYALEVDVLEDQPRTFFIINRGDDTSRGVVCGASLPDTLYAYTSANAEALDLPLAGGVRTWRSVFTLSERFAEINADSGLRPLLPADGFWVVIAQPEQRRLPGSGGAAVSSIRLRAIAQPASLELAIRRPPKELPWRHAFWREEMADGVIADADPAKRAFANRLDWYAAKMRTMKLLGYSAFAKDLLEFGYNQGWDSAPYGGNDWCYQSAFPELWGGIVDLAGSRGVALMPYFEYTGSLGAHGLGYQKRCHPLGANADYTEISWVENANADLTDPDTRADFAKVLDCTVLRLKDRAAFLGVWLRPRPSELPISFADAALGRFAAATGTADASRARMQADGALRDRYYAWWMQQRRAFLVDIRDRLRGAGMADASVLFTVAANESTPALAGDPIVAESDTARWTRLVSAPDQNNWRPVLSLAQATSDTRYADALRAPCGTYGGWEWQHAAPWADPQDYAATPGVCMTYQYNRRYTATVAAGMDAFRAPGGLGMIRQYPLNERAIPADSPLGYVCVDLELAGPASVLSEVLAVANGDPRWLGALNGRSLASGYPEYLRPFYAAFLALPALPSRVLPAATTAPGVVVRAIDGGAFGTWLAIANPTYGALRGVAIAMPVSGVATDAATGAALPTSGSTLTIDLAACSLRAVRIVAGTPAPNRPPTVAMTGPGGGATAAPATLVLTATAADADGSIARVEFSQGATLLGQATTAPYGFVWTSVPAGTYSVTARAIDDAGAATTSAPLTITVAATPSARAPFGGSPRAITSLIQAEDYDVGGEGTAYHDATAANQGGAYRADAVDLEPCADAGGGCDVGWIVAGEWLEYAVTVPRTGAYAASLRTASAGSGGSVSLAIDGVAMSTVTVPVTGGWQSWTTVSSSSMPLVAGAHVLRVRMDGGSGYLFNLNSLTFAPADPPGQPTVSAGVAQAVTLPASATLAGSATASSAVKTTWSKVAGPGPVTFADAHAQRTNAAFGSAGAYTLRLSATDAGGATASADVAITVAMPSASPAVIGCTLIDADTGRPIAAYDPIPEGATIDTALCGTTHLNLRANPAPGPVGSVRFGLDGAASYRIENVAPYALAGDLDGAYLRWTLGTGAHTVVATPFSGAGASVAAGAAETVRFTLVVTPTGPG